MYLTAVSFQWRLCSDLSVQCCHLVTNAVQDIQRTDWGTHLIKDTASYDLYTQQKFPRSICSETKPHTEVNRKTDSLIAHTHTCTHMRTTGSYSNRLTFKSLNLWAAIIMACVTYTYISMTVPWMVDGTPWPEFWFVTFTPWETVLLMRSGKPPLLFLGFLL